MTTMATSDTGDAPDGRQSPPPDAFQVHLDVFEGPFDLLLTLISKHKLDITEIALSADELIDLEHARLKLRRFGFVLDRGRLVREAIAILLADLDARGADSLIARRIRLTREAGGDPAQDKDEDAVPSLTWAPRQAAQ